MYHVVGSGSLDIAVGDHDLRFTGIDRTAIGEIQIEAGVIIIQSVYRIFSSISGGQDNLFSGFKLHSLLSKAIWAGDGEVIYPFKVCGVGLGLADCDLTICGRQRTRKHSLSRGRAGVRLLAYGERLGRSGLNGLLDCALALRKAVYLFGFSCF